MATKAKLNRLDNEELYPDGIGRVCWKNPENICPGVTRDWKKSWSNPQGDSDMEIPRVALLLNCGIFCEFDHQDGGCDE